MRGEAREAEPDSWEEVETTISSIHPDLRDAVRLLLSHRNSEQRAAILHPPDTEPLLILGGAGTGKTAVMAGRIAFLLLAEFPLDSITAVTFTRKAARELRGRLRAELSRLAASLHGAASLFVEECLAGIEFLRIGTFHSVCLEILHARGGPAGDKYPAHGVSNLERLGYAAHTRVVGEREFRELVAECSAGARYGADTLFVAGAILHAKGATPPGSSPVFPKISNRSTARAVSEIYTRYQERLKRESLLDFEDILLLTLRLFREEAEIAEAWLTRFRALLVDEFQDTNPVQYRVARALARESRNFLFAGDDAQAIYGWRGADPAVLDRFLTDHPAARVVKLVRNYRSDKFVLAAANALLARGRNPLGRELLRERRERDRGERLRIVSAPTERDETSFAAGEILDALRRGINPSNVGVLARTNRILEPLAVTLESRGVPILRPGAPSPFSEPSLLAVISALGAAALGARTTVRGGRWDRGDAECFSFFVRLALGNPSFLCHDASMRLRGSGPLTCILGASLPASAGISASPHLARGLRNLGILINEISGVLVEARLPELIEYLRLRMGVGEPPTRELAAAWARIQERAEGAGGRDTMEEILQLVEEVHSRAGLGADEGEEPEIDAAPEAVRFLSLHAAKGLEFDDVFLLGVEEGFLPFCRGIPGGEARPDNTDIDEERRLFFVGVTRARRRLTLLHSRSRERGARVEQRFPSPFLSLLPPSVTAAYYF